MCAVSILTSNWALIVSIDTQRSLFMKFFISPINSGVLTSLLLPHRSSSLTDSLPSLNLLCLSKTDARFMQDAPKAVWSIPYVSVEFFPSLKQNFIAYRSSKVSSRPDCIFEVHQLWQSGFSRVYSNCCCSCSFEPEIIKLVCRLIRCIAITYWILKGLPQYQMPAQKSMETYWMHHVYLLKHSNLLLLAHPKSVVGST